MADKKQLPVLPEKQLTKLRELAQANQNAKAETADAAVYVRKATMNLNQKSDMLIASHEDLEDYLKNLEDLYGKVNIDISTGEMTPIDKSGN